LAIRAVRKPVGSSCTDQSDSSEHGPGHSGFPNQGDDWLGEGQGQGVGDVTLSGPNLLRSLSKSSAEDDSRVYTGVGSYVI
jgi:hypothetical protein